MKINDFIEIIPPKNFNFNECLVFLNRSNREILHRIHEKSIFKAIQINEENVLLHITIKNSRIHVTFPLGTPISSEMKLQISQYITEWFDLERDVIPFYKMAEKDPILRNLVNKYKGYRVIGIPDLFEALTWAIIGQQINLTFAYQLKKRLVEQFGEKMLWDEKSYWLFPQPDQIASINVSDLTDLQFTRRKAEYIIDIAKMACRNELSKKSLRQKDYDGLKKKLLSIRGVGSWTADYVIMRCFYRTNAFPIADVGLQRALQRQLGLDRKPTIEEIMKLAQPWKGWESYATFYLWRSAYD